MKDRELVIARSITQAIKLKTGESSFLSGGTEVNRLDSSVKAKVLIGIKNLPLNQISLSKIEDENNKNHEYVKIGSTATFQQIIESKLTPEYLKDACYFMSSRTKRNMGTIGGNIALLRDDSYLYSTLLSSDALVEISNSSGSKTLSLQRYMENHAKYSNHLIIAVYVNPRFVVFSKRYANTQASHAVITMSVGWCRGIGYRVSLALKNSGIYTFPTLTEFMDANLREKEEEYLEYFNKCDDIKVKDDIYGSKEYKRYLLGVTCFDLFNEVKERREEAKK